MGSDQLKELRLGRNGPALLNGRGWRISLEFLEGLQKMKGTLLEGLNGDERGDWFGLVERTEKEIQGSIV